MVRDEADGWAERKGTELGDGRAETGPTDDSPPHAVSGAASPGPAQAGSEPGHSQLRKDARTEHEMGAYA